MSESPTIEEPKEEKNDISEAEALLAELKAADIQTPEDVKNTVFASAR